MGQSILISNLSLLLSHKYSHDDSLSLSLSVPAAATKPVGLPRHAEFITPPRERLIHNVNAFTSVCLSMEHCSAVV